jgi:hypothetical protein
VKLPVFGVFDVLFGSAERVLRINTKTTTITIQIQAKIILFLFIEKNYL